MNGEHGYLRIGELSRRTGVAPELLRAWERRYGLLRPARSEGGFRLYSDADERRVEQMRQHLRRGLAAAEAARLAVEGGRAIERVEASPGLEAAAKRLRESLDSFDEARAQAVLDELLATFTVETVLSAVLLPYLAELGERWSRGEATVAQEHFASNLIRGRLMALGRGWGRGMGKHALLAAPSGEQHDLGLVVLALVLRDRGWRVTFLGADTPIETITDTARRVAPEVIVLAMLKPMELQPDDVRALARSARVLFSGRGASPEFAKALGVEHFDGGPIEAAGYLTNGGGRSTR